MASMRKRTKIILGFAILLFVLFLLGISDRGQRYLIGTPALDHWERDDQYMGAAIAPYVYCLAPSLILTAFGAVFYIADRMHGLAK